MLLRRITEHVKAQNWTAVALDFVIVVTGVFIGLQVSDWNENRKIKQNYAEAQARLIAESKANLEATSTFLSAIVTNLPTVRQAIDALRSCSADPDAAAKIADGLNVIRGTPTLRLRHTALDVITRNDDFLGLKSEEERERLNELKRRLSQAQETLDWLEDWPFELPIEEHPAVRHGDLIASPLVEDYLARPILLGVPVEEACRDESLAKRFYRWERAAEFQKIRGRQVSDWLAENVTEMESR